MSKLQERVVQNVFESNIFNELLSDEIDNLIESVLLEQDFTEIPIVETDKEEGETRDEKGQKWANKQNVKLDKGNNDDDAQSSNNRILNKDVQNKLNTDKYNNAEISRQIWDIPDTASENEQGTARSLFSKKANGFTDDNGYTYHFTDKELTRIMNYLNSN